MRQVFIKWFYGFMVPEAPLIAFGKGRAKLLVKQARDPKAVVVFLGTEGPETENPRERGCLLGMAEFENEIATTLHLIDIRKQPSLHFNDRNQYRWPECVRVPRAWKFRNPPHRKTILTKPLLNDARTMAIEVGPADAEKILALKTEEVSIPERLKEQPDFIEAYSRATL